MRRWKIRFVGRPISNRPCDFLPNVLDSIGLTALVTLIEEEWDFMFDDEELEPELFESLSVLAGAVGKKLASAG